MVFSNIVWIDIYVNDVLELNTNENKDYLKILKSLSNFKVKCFNDVYESMIYLKSIRYEETFIIVSGRLYTELIQNLNKNYSDLYILPKIIIFTKNIKDFKSKNVNFQNKYDFSIGIHSEFEPLKKDILKESKITQILLDEKKKDKDNMIPELIDNKEQLILPILYKMLIKINTKDNENNKTPLELLAKNYSKNYYDDNSKFR